MNKFLSIIVVVGVLVLGGAAYSLGTFAFTPAHPGTSTSVVFEVRKGEQPREIIHTLVAQGVVTDGSRFNWLARINRTWKRLKAGEYEVNTGMTPMQVLSVISSGISMSHPLTVREGENMYEIADSLEQMHFGTAAQFIKICRDPQFMKGLGFVDPLPVSLEGYLYPETYFLTRQMSLFEIIRNMVHKAFSVWTTEDLERAKSLGLTRHQAVILASMIEKETGAPEERPMISSVFHNRLQKKMRLQSDPTIIYGMWDRYDGNIHKSDILTPSPYNTYTINALPIGPISNPGIEALHAAVNPVHSDYLYFVSKNNGTHEFNATYAAHSDAVRRLQLDPKARAGKSWRDLSKHNQASAR